MSAGQTDLRRAVLSIAGSDPSGGAGIQADLKTFAAIGVYGAAAITCLTAQNTLGVSSFLAVDPDFLKAQIRLVLDDLPVSHVKTGMIGTAAVAKAVGETLADFSGEIICDPVIRASDGADLLANADLATWQNEIVARATVLTPNLPELGVLTGIEPQSAGEAVAAAGGLFARLPKLRAIILTGGHLDEQSDAVSDFLLLRGSEGWDMHEAGHQRIQTRNTHGTGCTFASAFAAFHLLTGDYRTAFRQTVDFMDILLRKSAQITMGKGKGPLLHHLYRKK